MQTVLLGNIVKIKTGKLDANAKVEGGKYPFFTCAREISWIDKPTYDCECVLVAGNGDLNVKYYHGKFDAYQRTYIIESNNTSELSIKYLYYFMQSYLEKLRGQTIGGVIQYIKMNNLTDIQIPLPSLEEQKSIIAKLDKLIELINLKKEAIGKTEQLTKSIFLEMFGNLMINPKKWELKKLEDLLEDRKNLSYGIVQAGNETEGGVRVLRPVDIVDDILYLDEVKRVSLDIESKYKKTRLKGGEVLLVVRGATGGIIIAPKECAGFNVTRGLAVIKTRDIDAVYLTYYLRSQEAQNYIREHTRGATLQQINLGDLREMHIAVPPYKLQQEFAVTEQINQSIIEDQKQSLQSLQELYDTTIQEIFSF